MGAPRGRGREVRGGSSVFSKMCLAHRLGKKGKVSQAESCVWPLKGKKTGEENKVSRRRNKGSPDLRKNKKQEKIFNIQRGDCGRSIHHFLMGKLTDERSY